MSQDWPPPFRSHLDEANRSFEKVQVDTFLNSNAVGLQQFGSPGASKTVLSEQKFQRKFYFNPAILSVIDYAKQRGRSYQGLWWHLQVHWRMGSIPGKDVVAKKTACPENFHIPRSTWSPWVSSRSTSSWATSTSLPSSPCSPLPTGAQVQSWQLFVDKLARSRYSSFVDHCSNVLHMKLKTNDKVCVQFQPYLTCPGRRGRNLPYQG